MERRSLLKGVHVLIMVVTAGGAMVRATGAGAGVRSSPHEELRETADVTPRLAVSDRISMWNRCIIASWDRTTGETGSEAVLSTNSSSSGRVRIAGHARVRGSVYVGPGGRPGSVIAVWGDSEITGETGTLAQSVDIPVYSLPEGLPRQEGNLTINNHESMMISADRRFNDLRLYGDAVLTVDRPVNVVIDGRLEVAGRAQIRIVESGQLNLFIARSAGVYGDATVNAATPDPSRLRIHMMGADKFELTDSAMVCARVYHTHGELEAWGGSRFFGTFVGKRFEAGDRARIYLDNMSAGGTSSAGRTFYVRTSGSDSSSGLSPAAAWRSVGRAADVMHAGDKVFIGPGAYDEKITPANDGTEDQRIEFVADVTGEQTGDAPGPVTIVAAGDAALWVEDDDNLTFTGFTFKGGSNAVAQFRNCIGGRLIGCIIRDASGHSGDGIEIDDAELTVENCTIQGNRDDGIALRSRSQVTIIAGDISHNGGDGIYSADDENVLVVRQSRILDNSRDGLRVAGSAIIVNTLVAANQRDGITTSDHLSTEITIANATVINNGDHGVQLRNGRMSIVNSIIAFNDDDGLDRDGGRMEHTYNIVYGNGRNFSGTSKHVDDRVVDPLLAGGSDYRLLVNSPGIDAGTSLPSVTTIDIDATSRPVGDAWDIGCYEGPGERLLFTDVSRDTGFDQLMTSSETYGSGWYWGDLDEDGDLDAIATGNSARMFINQGAGESFFVSSFGGSVRRQGALVDLDNDGDLDFWAGNDNSNYASAFFENDGSASFVNRGDLGFAQPSNNEGVAVTDVNQDGWCDIVMCSQNGNWIGLNAGGDPPAISGTDAIEYGLNAGSDVGNGDYCSAADVNEDGRLDLFYHCNGGRLFLSDGDGTFTSQSSGISLETGPDDKFGSAWGDYDNDGDIDLFVPGFRSGQPAMLWRNDRGTFTNVAVEAGLVAGTSERSACWGDYDNDGCLDLYVVSQSGTNRLYHNNGDGTFEEVNEGVAATGKGHDAVFVDYDHDGDLDLAVTREDAPAVLLRNNTNNDRFLLVRVFGAGAGATPRSANGVRIDLLDSSGSELLARREIGAARGFGGAEPMWAHFGGVDPNAEYLLRIYFASQVREMNVVPVEATTLVGGQVIAQMITIRETVTDQVRVIRWREVEPAGR